MHFICRLRFLNWIVSFLQQDKYYTGPSSVPKGVNTKKISLFLPLPYLCNSLSLHLPILCILTAPCLSLSILIFLLPNFHTLQKLTMQRLFYLEKKIDKPAKKSQKETKQGRGGKTYILSLERKKSRREGKEGPQNT